jgi:leucyl aminopeptidase
MQFEVWTKGLATLNVDCLVLGIFEDGEMAEEAQSIDAVTAGHLKRLLARGDFSGRAGETWLLAELPGISASRALLTGLGAKKSFGRKPWRRALSAAAGALARTRIASVAVAIDRPVAKELDDYYFGRAVAEIISASLYRTNDLKTSKKPKPAALQKVIAGPVRKAGVAAAERGRRLRLEGAARSCQPAGQCMHTGLSCGAVARPRQAVFVAARTGTG